MSGWKSCPTFSRGFASEMSSIRYNATEKYVRSQFVFIPHVFSVEMKPGVFDARYSSRLSSLIDIHTLENKNARRAGEAEAGISGIGALSATGAVTS